MKDNFYMEQALIEAKKAYAIEEVPIGAVIVYEDQIIARGYNRRNIEKNPLCHAEILAIHQAAQWMGDWRLEGCRLYVTIEPCPMCAGAIVQARIPVVVFGARNPKAGSAGSVVNLLEEKGFNHQVQVVEGVLAEDCSQLMRDFFRHFREKKEKEKKS